MALTVGTAVKVINRHSSITLRGEAGVITEIDGSTYIVQMDKFGERYFGANELTEVDTDYKSWNNYKLLNMLEREIRSGASDDRVMDLQNEIFSRMSH